MKGVHEPDPRRGSMDQESMFCTFPFFGLVSTLFLRRARQILKRVHLSGGLWLRNYCAVAGNHKFSMQFSVFACFCGGYSNRVKRLRRLSGNFILLKASLFNKGLSFRARPSQSGLPSVSPSMWGGVGR